MLQKGLIHVYMGDGKGKTTAALGLALRMAGRGGRVLLAQFLKSENSGERAALRQLPGVTLLPLPEQVKFVFQMTPEEKAAYAEETRHTLHRAAEESRIADLLILDEALGALETGLLPLEELLRFLDGKPAGLEVVLTGRAAPQLLLDRADYITRMDKVKHPFDRGIAARKGIEY